MLFDLVIRSYHFLYSIPGFPLILGLVALLGLLLSAPSTDRLFPGAGSQTTPTRLERGFRLFVLGWLSVFSLRAFASHASYQSPGWEA